MLDFDIILGDKKVKAIGVKPAGRKTQVLLKPIVKQATLMQHQESDAEISSSDSMSRSNDGKPIKVQPMEKDPLNPDLKKAQSIHTPLVKSTQPKSSLIEESNTVPTRKQEVNQGANEGGDDEKEETMQMIENMLDRHSNFDNHSINDLREVNETRPLKKKATEKKEKTSPLEMKSMKSEAQTTQKKSTSTIKTTTDKFSLDVVHQELNSRI